MRARCAPGYRQEVVKVHLLRPGTAAPPLQSFVKHGRTFMIGTRLGVVVLGSKSSLTALVLAPVRAVLVFRNFRLGFGTVRARRRLLALVRVVGLDGLRRYGRTGDAGRLRFFGSFRRCGRVPTNRTRR